MLSNKMTFSLTSFVLCVMHRLRACSVSRHPLWQMEMAMNLVSQLRQLKR